MTTDRASAIDLWWLAEHVEDLTEARLKGTPRPWRQGAAWDSNTRALADDAARHERADRTDLAVGEHPAPLHVDTLDLLVDLLATAHELSDTVAQAAGVDRMPYPTSSYADPTPYLRHAAAHLRDAHLADQAVGPWVEAQAARLRSEVAVALGDVQGGQTLAAICPWCRGGIDGQFTLRIRISEDRTLVVCESGTCEPSEADCGLRHRGQPAWDVASEGEWLAARIEHAAA